MAFTFNSPVKIVFGEGCADQVGQELVGLGAKKVLVVTGPGHRHEAQDHAGSAQAGHEGNGHEGAFETVVAALKKAGLEYVRFAGAGADPTPAMVEEGACVFKEARCDAILALGGGSPMDCAKAISASVGEGRPFADFVGTGRVLAAPVPPLVAVPTTAGTGSEVSGTSVLTIEKDGHKMKLGTSGATLFPKAAFVDPLLHVSMPKALTAATGMDALTHAIECYVGRQHTPLADLYCIEAMRLIGLSLRRACQRGDDLEARGNMALAATCAGVALSNASLGMVHGFAHALGALCGMAHGTANAIMLPYVMAGCVDDAAQRLALAGAALTGTSSIDAHASVAALFSLDHDIGIPRSLAEAGVPESMLKPIYEDAKNYKRRPMSPHLFTDEELWQTLYSAWSGTETI